MSDEIVRSPCVNICFLEDNDVCVGCYRHSDEITEWAEASVQRRKEILEKCFQRRKESGAIL